MRGSGILGHIGRRALAARGIEVGSEFRLYGWPVIRRHPGSSVTIGDRAVLISRSPDTALGVRHAVIIRTLAEGASVRIGNDVGMSGTTICAVAEIRIGDECLIGADVMIVDTDFHPIAPQNRRFAPITEAAHAPVVIERNVFLGAGSSVMKGVRIGENSVIGCGSVVTRDIPANSVAGGNPCRVLRTL